VQSGKRLVFFYPWRLTRQSDLVQRQSIGKAAAPARRARVLRS
jgi:hypothetical protein